MINPTGRSEAEWKKYNPHGSYHADGRFHHKAFDRKILKRQGQMPDGNFRGTVNLVTRPIATDEPRAFGVNCRVQEFSSVFEIPIGDVSPKKYETYIAVDLTEPGGTLRSQILKQFAINDAVPWILVTLLRY